MITFFSSLSRALKNLRDNRMQEGESIELYVKRWDLGFKLRWSEMTKYSSSLVWNLEASCCGSAYWQSSSIKLRDMSTNFYPWKQKCISRVGILVIILSSETDQISSSSLKPKIIIEEYEDILWWRLWIFLMLTGFWSPRIEF